MGELPGSMILRKSSSTVIIVQAILSQTPPILTNSCFHLGDDNSFSKQDKIFSL